MQYVKPKKNLGQHFLRDEGIAQKIAESLTGHGQYQYLLEIGPGTGVLSKYLFEQSNPQWWGMDVDEESIAYLHQHYPQIKDRALLQDFLHCDLNAFYKQEPFAVIGNFPYNISTQILFKILEHRNQIPEMVGMFQKEVAQRVVAGPGGKVNGILSILCQAFYDIEYLFQVGEHVFNPPPKVKSAVIRFRRNQVAQLACNEKLFFTVVKTAYNQRRKTLRNALKSMPVQWDQLPEHLGGQRAEQLSVGEFIAITQAVDKFAHP